LSLSDYIWFSEKITETIIHYEVEAVGNFFTAIEPIKPMSFEKSAEATVSAEKGSSAIPFADVLRDAIDTYTEAKKVSEADASVLALGNANDLAQLQINGMKASAALSTTVQLTSRAVNAYKEIMQMQV